MSRSELPLIVSFYTPDWLYPEHARRLAGECESLRLEHHIECRPSAGSYLSNTCQKPQFILECLNYGKPILWVDVDASILQRPEFFTEEGYDMQARRMTPDRRRTWHVGTMYWAPTEAAVSFVDAWAKNTGEMSDESSLEVTWKQLGHTLSTRDIPPEYFEIPRFGGPGSKECVILHRLSNSPSKRQQRKMFQDYEQHIG